MIRAIAAFAAMSAPAFAGFCTDDLAGLGLTANLLAPGATLMLHDPGAAQLLCLDCVPGFLSVDIFLGRPDPAVEAGLRDGSITAATLQNDCRATTPDCIVTPLAAGRAVGFRRVHQDFNGAQVSYRLHLDGQSVTVRATAPADQHDAVAAAAARIYDTILPPLLNCA